MNFNPLTIQTIFKSNYVPVVALKPEVQAKIDAEFLTPKASTFFTRLHINYLSVEYIGFDNSITEKEFIKLDEELAKSYLYEKIFTNPKKDSQKKVRSRIKFCWTFDRDLTPFYLDGTKYGVITLGEKPIFYYIFIDLQELINFIKNNV